MKYTSIAALVLAMSGAGFAYAHADGMHGKDMPMKHCMDMQGMKGSGMAGMDMQKCQDMMQQHGKQNDANGEKAAIHQTDAVVKAVDTAKGKVTLAHEPVKSLKWPAMTMVFLVKDKALFDKLPVGQKVQVEFMKQGTDYIVTAVK